MKTKRVNRYYCDFCNKSGCNAGHIKEHEKKCCHNPGRICEMCGSQGRDYRNLIAVIGKHGLGTVRDLVDNCPWCILAVIIQSRPSPTSRDFDGDGWWDEFDFKKEKEEWFNERAALERQIEDEQLSRYPCD